MKVYNIELRIGGRLEERVGDAFFTALRKIWVNLTPLILKRERSLLLTTECITYPLTPNTEEEQPRIRTQNTNKSWVKLGFKCLQNI